MYQGSENTFRSRIDPQSLCYGFPKEIMDHPCWNGGLGITRIRCTKFNEGCTKFCEGCTKGSKVRFKVGINPQSFHYAFLNEIMDHPCWNGSLGICQIGCTKGRKMLSEAGICPISLCFGFLNEIVAHPWTEEGPGITRIGCTKFCEGCNKGPKMRSEVGIHPQ